MLVNKVLQIVKTSKLFKSLSVYFVSQLVTALLPIIIIPIISRTLSLNDYGSYSLYKSIFGFLIPLVGLSFSNAVVRKYYSIEKENFMSYMLTLIVTITIAAVFLYLVLILNMGYLLRVLKTDDQSIVLYSLYVAYFTSISSILLGYYRVINDSKRYFISNILIIVVTICGVLFLRYQYFLTLSNLLNVHLIAVVISVFYNLLDFFKGQTSKLSIDFSYLKDTFKYCLPLVLFSLLAQVFALGDRFFINYYLDKDKLALYSTGLQMAFAIPLVGQSIQLAWTPFVFEKMTHSERHDQLKKITIFFWIILVVFTVLYIIVYPYIFKLFLPRNYDSVLQYYYLFIIAGLFQSLYWLYNPFLLFYERNSLFVYITLIAALASIILDYIYVERGLIWMASIYTLSWFLQFILLLIAIRYVKNLKKRLQDHSQNPS